MKHQKSTKKNMEATALKAQLTKLDDYVNENFPCDCVPNPGPGTVHNSYCLKMIAKNAAYNIKLNCIEGHLAENDEIWE